MDKICKELGIKPIEPLRGANSEQILTDFVDQGFEAIVVSVKADLFDEGWLGRKVDRDFVRDLYKLKDKLKIHKHVLNKIKNPIRLEPRRRIR